MRNQIIKLLIGVATVLCGQSFERYTIFSPTGSGGNGSNGTSYLINNDFTVIHTWQHSRGAASMPYLIPDSTIIYPYRVPNPTMDSGGVGGGIAHIDWNNNILWEYTVSNNQYQHHHDVEPLPNGNILVIAWERKTAAEAFAMGRLTLNNSLNEMWSEAILELEPVGANAANVVWEWHLWDHLIQNVNSALSNYGVVSEHPELMDINYGSVGGGGGPGGSNADWMHFNAIDYNPELDQIVVSSRTMGEVYIIDHSTTTAEAAAHSGGNSNHGGDFLYRWGNPQVYDRGTAANQQLNSQHGVNWIPAGYPGEGHLILYDNVYNNNQSAVYEIETPIDSTGNYFIDGASSYGPNAPAWIHTGGFYSNVQGGAFRLSNGNTLITDADNARIFEVTPEHTVVWNYTYSGNNVMIARGQPYELDYLSNDFPEYILGDINFDQYIDILDVIQAVDMVLNIGYNPTPPADLNNDGTVTIEDVIALVQMAMNE